MHYADEPEAEWSGEMFPGLFYERPLTSKVPRHGCVNQVGLDRWRVSSNGIVRVSTIKVSRVNPLYVGPGCNVPYRIFSQDWFIQDVVTGKQSPLTEQTKGRLRPLWTGVEGFGHLSMPVPNGNARRDVRECDKCHVECPYPAGRGPGVGDFHDPSSLRASEWAELHASVKSLPEDIAFASDMFGDCQVSVVRIVCSACIPKGFVFCGNCNLVHKGWRTSGFLKPFSEFIEDSASHEFMNEFVHRQYRGSGKTPDGGAVWCNLKPRLSDRVAELVSLIGRSAVCENPDKNISRNLSVYLEELQELENHWKAYLKTR